MPDIVMHHYPLSTFSEKVRLALGLKQLHYQEVITPVMMPKPDLLPLTGGYRRAPVMQIGADVYCDTQLILRTLERLHPEPSLFPDGTEGQATAIAAWAERCVFTPALGFIANVNPALYPPDFVRERKAFGFDLGLDDVQPLFGRYRQQLGASLATLSRMLADGRPFLLGAQPGAGDLGAYPAVWFLRKHGGAATGEHLRLEALLPWVERVAALGYGQPHEITGAEALDLARDATPAAPNLAQGGDPSGLAAGTPVTVTPDDTGRDPVAGVLVGADADEVVIRREDARVGVVHVHFPRAGHDVVAG